MFEMFEIFFFSWEPFPGDVKSIKEFEFTGFISERFTLHWETGMALKTKLFKAIVLHLVNNYINLRQQISYIYRRYVPIKSICIGIFADISGGWCKYVCFFFSRLTENQNEEGMAFYEKKLRNIIIPRCCLDVEYRPDIWQVPIEKKRKTISKKCQIRLI